MASPTEHHETAVSLLSQASAYAVNCPARAATLAEAQVHATLALFVPAPRLILGSEVDESAAFEPSASRLIALPEDAPVVEVVELAKPAPKRRTRKPKAEPAPETFDEVVPGSEEDVIRQEQEASA